MAPKYALIYVHGFLSSGRARKAMLTKEYLDKNSPNIVFEAPDLPDEPASAWKALELTAQKLSSAGFRLGFIGGSMGGFFSMYMAPRFEARACLVNPCVDPYSLLPAKSTSFTNPYTQKQFVIDESYKENLRIIESANLIKPSKLSLYLEAGDEVLDYHQALEKFNEFQLPISRVLPGGHHTFDHYEDFLPEMLDFLFIDE